MNRWIDEWIKQGLHILLLQNEIRCFPYSHFVFALKGNFHRNGGFSGSRGENVKSKYLKVSLHFYLLGQCTTVSVIWNKLRTKPFFWKWQKRRVSKHNAHLRLIIRQLNCRQLGDLEIYSFKALRASKFLGKPRRLHILFWAPLHYLTVALLLFLTPTNLITTQNT